MRARTLERCAVVEQRFGERPLQTGFGRRRRLDLESTALVAFSGCSTARGPLHAGEGPWGLPVAAWIAGAGASLATLWDVDDDAMPEQVSAFYDAWSEGASPAVALQRALLATIARLRAARGHAHPATWAALVVEGL
jgi:CHAT domain-containing protein